MADGADEIFLKPMNCPSHMTLYNTALHSYRELPIRYAEFATLYRFEKSGELIGLTRVRAPTQDDAHIFCTPSQLQDEFAAILDLVRTVLDTYGLSDYRVALSPPPTRPQIHRRAGALGRSLAALRQALTASGLAYDEVEGEAAFYGPKADFFARDVLAAASGNSPPSKSTSSSPSASAASMSARTAPATPPVMLHRAITGTTERFLAILIEHYEGNFPAWLAPLQARLIPIADRHFDYAPAVSPPSSPPPASAPTSTTAASA